MGKSNYCPSGEYTDQWYVDYDQFTWDTPSGEPELDYKAYIDVMDEALREIEERFPSFTIVTEKKYGDRYWSEEYQLENKLFRIGLADNEWSGALFIQMRDDLEPEQQNLARKHFESYTSAIRQVMLKIFGEISIRTGAYTSRTIRLEDEVAS